MLMIFSLQDDITEGERMRKVIAKEFEIKDLSTFLVWKLQDQRKGFVCHKGNKSLTCLERQVFWKVNQ